MTRRANRLLHVLLCAPAAALVAAAATPSAHAVAGDVTSSPVRVVAAPVASSSMRVVAAPVAPPSMRVVAATVASSSMRLVAIPSASADPPRPIVVCLDPGHGGKPDNAHPDRPFDPGTVGPNGLLEKDVALDLARRLRRLLEADLVEVVMTRDSDIWLDIPTRSQFCNQSGASAMVSIHLNGFQDPSVGGSVVLYPHADQPQFAQTMSDALAKRLAPFGIADDGIMLRDNWWLHTTMPTVTVESAYLTNPREADLLARDDVRAAIAAGMRDGIELELPQIAQRKAEILSWRQLHPAAVLGVHVPQGAVVRELGGRGGGLGRVALVGLLLGAGVSVVLARHRLGRALLLGLVGLGRLGGLAGRRVVAPLIGAPSGTGRRPRATAIGQRRGRDRRLPSLPGSLGTGIGRGISFPHRGRRTRRARLARRHALLARTHRPSHRQSVFDELDF